MGKILRLQSSRLEIRDCLDMGENQAPPAPHFIFLITL